MPLRDRTRASTAAILLGIGIVSLAPTTGCGGHGPMAKPTAALASSPQAAAAFDAVREAWKTMNVRPSSPDLRPMLRGFLARFPHDGLAPLARVALAVQALKVSDFATADAELALTEGVAPGTTHDLRKVALARRLRIQGRSDDALLLLRPLMGKTVDPMVRSVFQEELTLSAIEAHRDYEAVSYMDAWLRGSPEEDKPETIKRVAAIVGRLPREVLVGAFTAMRSQRKSFGYGVDIERVLAERLIHIAAKTSDPALARMLLDTDPGAVAAGGSAAAALGELAASRRGLNVVAGRTVGLLLPTESPGLRDESADVLRGVMWALGLPHGARTTSPAPATQGPSAPKGSRGRVPDAAPEATQTCG
ncbi:MAG: hypothetical protein ACREJ3_09430, partial [Polyangiaceae bacterium]